MDMMREVDKDCNGEIDYKGNYECLQNTTNNVWLSTPSRAASDKICFILTRDAWYSISTTELKSILDFFNFWLELQSE